MKCNLVKLLFLKFVIVLYSVDDYVYIYVRILKKKFEDRNLFFIYDIDNGFIIYFEIVFKLYWFVMMNDIILFNELE